MHFISFCSTKPPGPGFLQTSFYPVKTIRFFLLGDFKEKYVGKYKNMYKQFSILWPHPIPGSHDFNNLDFVLCQKAFV
jgi:hypothetical protein